MNRIILIGNGFDLAHGLKTSYNDFIAWFWKKQMQEVEKNKTDKDKTYKNSYIEVTDLKKFISDVLLGEEKKSITYQNKFLEQIDKEIGKKTWLDIERIYFEELKKAKKKYEYRNKKDLAYIKNLNQEFDLIRYELNEYLNEEIRSKGLVKEDKINEYFYKEFQKEFEKIIFRECDNIDKILFLNFNYTNTEELYSESREDIVVERQVIHIHETLKDADLMIFGYGDEKSKESKEIEDLNENEFLKNVKSVNYTKSTNYYRLESFIEERRYEILILGHSCGNSDRTLLNLLFEHKNCEKIKVYYYQKDKDIREGKKEFNNLSANIYRNFDEKRTFRSRLLPFEKSSPSPNIEYPKFKISSSENEVAKSEFVSNAKNSILDDLIMVHVEIGTEKIVQKEIKQPDKDYQISKYQITQKQWEIIMGKSVRDIAKENNWNLYGEGDNYPMYYVSWDDVQDFIKRLNQETGMNYRLPTESEWEYAARGGNQSRKCKYSGSNNIAEVAWYVENSGGKIHPVGQLKPNELGIYDMSGNVYEWCKNIYGTTAALRMLRGGNWRNSAEHCTVSHRDFNAPGNRSSIIGFRLVLPQRSA